jgi:hypothetical protein
VQAVTILVFLVALIAAPVVNSEMQRRYLARGEGWLRSTVKSGSWGLLTMVAVLAAYFALGTLLARLLN